MESLTKNIELHIPKNLFLKNPKESTLGNRLLREAATLIAVHGIDHFNFKKLAAASQCTEATVYRYFENKHKLLLYLLNIYWGWQEYSIVFATSNLAKARQKLQKACAQLAAPDLQFVADKKFAQNLMLIAVQEGVKIHLTPSLKQEINDGSMSCYYRLIQRIADFIRQTDPAYSFPVSLASSLMDIALQQLFYSVHYEELTDTNKDHSLLNEFMLQLLPVKIKHG